MKSKQPFKAECKKCGKVVRFKTITGYTQFTVIDGCLCYQCLSQREMEMKRKLYESLKEGRDEE